MKKNILIIGPHPNSWGGTASCIKTLKESPIINDSYNFLHLVTWKNGKWVFSFIKTLLNIKKAIKSSDLVHINISKKGSTYRKLILASFIKNKNYIVHIHYGKYGYFFENQPLFIRKKIIDLLEKAKYIIFVSNYQKEETLNKIHLENKNIKVIYNGINVCQNEQIDKEYLQVLYFGSILNSRHIDEFLDLADKFSDKNIKFLVAGNGNYNNYRSHNVEFIGYIEGETKKEILRNSDIIYDHFTESFGIGLIEAMNHYACPLVYPSGSIPEIIGDNEYGLYFNNKKELIENLKLLMNNKDLLKRYKNKAYERSLFFSNEKFINSFKYIYDEETQNV